MRKDLSKSQVQPPSEIRASYEIRPESLRLCPVRPWKSPSRESKSLCEPYIPPLDCPRGEQASPHLFSFQFNLIASHPPTMLHCEESESIFMISLQNPPLLKAEWALVPQLLLGGQVLHPWWVVSQCWAHSRFLTFFMHEGPQNWTRYLKGGRRTAE